MSVWRELKRRNVFKVGAAYAVIAWLLIEVAATLLPTFGAPAWVMPVFTALVILAFPLALVLAWAYEVTPEGIRKTAQVRPEESVRHLTGRRLDYFAFALLALAVAYFLVDRYVLDETSGPPSQGLTSVAVLPFHDLSGDAAQGYFADGMTDALIATLASVSTIRVTSRTSVMQFRDPAAAVPDIARALQVDSVIEGAVLREGDRVRITVRLIDAGTDRPVWSQSYERELRGILMLQGEVARTIVREMRAALTPEERRRLSTTQTVLPEAYDAYLRARFHFARLNEEDNFRAVELFERSVTLDPTFAAAHAELGLAYNYIFANFRPDEQEWDDRAQAAAEKALSLDPDIPEAYIVRGRSVWTPAGRYQHARAIREYRQALALNPLLEEAHYQLGRVFGHTGFFEASLAHLERALELNPDHIRARAAVGQTRLYQRRFEDALEVFAKMPADYSPVMNGYQKAWALFELGRHEEATAVLDGYLRDYPEDSAGILASMQAVILVARGEAVEAERLIAVAAGKNRNSLLFHHTAYSIAVAYALMDRPDEALQWLEYAARDGFPCLPLFEEDVNLQSVRDDPRFTRLLEEVKTQLAEVRSLASAARGGLAAGPSIDANRPAP